MLGYLTIQNQLMFASVTRRISATATASFPDKAFSLIGLNYFLFEGLACRFIPEKRRVTELVSAAA